MKKKKMRSVKTEISSSICLSTQSNNIRKFNIVNVRSHKMHIINFLLEFTCEMCQILSFSWYENVDRKFLCIKENVKEGIYVRYVCVYERKCLRKREEKTWNKEIKSGFYSNVSRIYLVWCNNMFLILTCMIIWSIVHTYTHLHRK